MLMLGPSYVRFSKVFRTGSAVIRVGRFDGHVGLRRFGGWRVALGLVVSLVDL